MQIIQQPDKITILYSETYEVRQMRMNQPHAGQVEIRLFEPFKVLLLLIGPL
jgi:hypothetical protein